jgi:mRNA deadenylase 3'-5' endonuclease subunit Ccr4
MASRARPGRGKKNQLPTEDNPIFSRKDWDGKTMEEFRTDGMWGWRSMKTVGSTKGGSAPPRHEGGSRLRIMSFNVLAQSLTSTTRFPYCNRQVLKWRHRRVSLIKEVLSLNADVLCLQEVDNYHEWWLEKMSLAGYDGVYLKKTTETRRDGVAIFYKRDLFQLFQTKEVKFDDLSSEFENPARALTGHVALIIGLQPWEESSHASAICVTSTQLISGQGFADIHWAQSRRLVKEVERFNSDFQLPIVVCGSINCTPGHEVYDMLTTGVLRELPKPPLKMEDAPVTGTCSRSTIRIAWEVPHEGDAPITGYKIRRRAGGNTAVGFKKEIDVPDSKATGFTVCQLSSGTMYEFIVAGVSAVGVGAFSEPTYPVATLTNFSNPPVNRSLLIAPPPRTTLQIQRMVQEKEAALIKERRAKGLSEIETIVQADDADDYDSSDEEDYGCGYGYSDGAAGVGQTIQQEMASLKLKSTKALQNDQGNSKEGDGEGGSNGGEGGGKKNNASDSYEQPTRQVQTYQRRNQNNGATGGVLGSTFTNNTPRFEDGRASFRQSPVRQPYASGTGRRETMRVHCMCLHSAYETYNAGSEPRCTLVHDTHNETVDYIFYNDETLSVRKLLSIPNIDDLRDLDPRAPDQVPDPYDRKPEGWDDRPRLKRANFDTGDMEEVDNPDYQGTWEPRMVSNMDKYHHFLPNSQFSSDHFALMAEFGFREGLLAATAWNSDVFVAGRGEPSKSKQKK